MKTKEESQHQLGPTVGKEEVLSDFATNIKNMEWLMADAVDDIYALEDGDE
jgi:hypothetical protein